MRLVDKHERRARVVMETVIVLKHCLCCPNIQWNYYRVADEILVRTRRTSSMDTSVQSTSVTHLSECRQTNRSFVMTKNKGFYVFFIFRDSTNQCCSNVISIKDPCITLLNSFKGLLDLRVKRISSVCRSLLLKFSGILFKLLKLLKFSFEFYCPQTFFTRFDSRSFLYFKSLQILASWP